jgi:hypothetical protein
MCESIRPFSLVHVGIAKFGDVTLYCKNLNYACFVTPEEILKVERKDGKLYIHMDRMVIRHCYSRYIELDLGTNTIKWFEVESKMEKIIPKKDMWFEKLQSINF